MLKFVPFNDLEVKHLDYIARSLLAAPLDTRLESADLLRGLQQGKLALFEWPDGCVVVSAQGRTLMIYALASKGLHTIVKTLRDDLSKLAAHWECDMIETTVFEPRLTSVIQKIGGRVESVNMVLKVE